MPHLLYSLYTKRQGAQHQREDFLSAALAGLMRRDRVACRIVLTALGLASGADLTHRAIQAQYTLPGTQDRPDLRVQLGAGKDATVILIECKLEREAHNYAHEQVAKYLKASRDGVQVGLIVARQHEPDWSREPWSAIRHHCTWEGIIEALRADNRRLDPWAVPDLRRDVIELAEDFGVGGTIGVTSRDLERAMTSMRRISAWQFALRTAVLGLLSPDRVHPAENAERGNPSSVAWDDDGPLEVWWESEEAPPECPWLEGLGLAADLSLDTGLPTLSWRIDAFLGESATEHAAARMGDADWRGEPGDWRSLTLAETADLHIDSADVLRDVVALGRAALGEVLPDLPLGTGEVSLPDGFAGLLDRHVADLQRVDRASKALDSWESALRRELLRALEQRFGKKVRQGKGSNKSGKLYVRGLRGKKREAELNTWSWMSVDDAGVGLWVWAGGVRANDALAPVLAEVTPPPGWRWTRHGSGGRDVQLLWQPGDHDLDANVLRHLCRQVVTALAAAKDRIRSG